MNGLKRCLRAAGMKQEHLAKALDVSASAVGAWAQGLYLPRAELLPRIAELLGCSIDDLYRDYTQEEDDTP